MNNEEEKKEEIEEEIDNFIERRKEIKDMVGKIGGHPTKHAKVINIVFFVVLIVAFIVPIFIESIPHIVALDIGVLLISIKIIYSLMQQARVNHYQFWILTTLEWRLHNITSDLKELKEQLNE